MMGLGAPLSLSLSKPMPPASGANGLHGRCHKLYGLVRKPLAALPNAAGRPLRHASKKDETDPGSLSQ